MAGGGIADENSIPVAVEHRGSTRKLGDLLRRLRDSALEEDDADDDETEFWTLPPATPSPLHRLQSLSPSADPIGRPPPFLLSFSNLTYTVQKRNPKILLDSVSGEAREGEILAVLGASGSGKSTLLDALAGRISSRSLQGTISLNGEFLHRRPNLLKAISAHVMQDDLLHPMLTVEETLMFAAEFRLPRSMSSSRKKLRVQSLIDQLGLRSAAGTIIGNELHRGVSGGEKRRVSIGKDIIHDPIILFLDEPTSGLDSSSALQVIEVLQKIAKSGSLVILTVHQPSSKILSLLDRLIFLSKGRTLYSGTAYGLAPFFSSFGRPIPENESSPEFALDLILELESSPSGTDALYRHFTRYSASAGDRTAPPTPFTLKDAINASMSRGKLVSGDRRRSGNYANPLWAEVVTLTRRSFTNARRQPELVLTLLGALIVTGGILAAIFWKLDMSAAGVQERLGFFALVVSTVFFTCGEVVPQYLLERHIFIRETAHNAYRRISYVLASTVTSLPSLVPLSLTLAGITYFAVGLTGGVPGFLFYWAVILACFWAGMSYMSFLSGIIRDERLGFTAVVATLSCFFLVAGFFVSRERLPDYWLWLHYASLLKYPYEAVMQNEFQDPRRCFVSGRQMFDRTALATAPEDVKLRLVTAIGGAMGVNMTGETCIVNGPYVLKLQGIGLLSKWACLWVIAAMGFAYRVFFYVALVLGGKNKRR